MLFVCLHVPGQNSSAVKLKTLTGAMEIMCETRHAFILIHKELLEQQEKVYTQTYTQIIINITYSFVNTWIKVSVTLYFNVM